MELDSDLDPDPLYNVPVCAAHYNVNESGTRETLITVPVLL